MNPNDKQSFWKNHISGWQSSELSQKAYCAQEGISYSNFGYWRKRFSKPGKLIQIPVTRPNGVVTIYLPTGVRIEVPVTSLADVIPLLEVGR